MPDQSAKIQHADEHDQTVNVTYTAPDTFTFDPPTTNMGAAGKILLKSGPGQVDWVFVSVNELPSPEYTWTLTGNGNGITIEDKHTRLAPSHYTVTVSDASGNRRTGPTDPVATSLPMIVNR